MNRLVVFTFTILISLGVWTSPADALVFIGGSPAGSMSLSEGIGSPQFQQLFQENESLDVFIERILGKD